MTAGVIVVAVVVGVAAAVVVVVVVVVVVLVTVEPPPHPQHATLAATPLTAQVSKVLHSSLETHPAP